MKSEFSSTLGSLIATPIENSIGQESIIIERPTIEEFEKDISPIFVGLLRTGKLQDAFVVRNYLKFI